MQQNGGTPWPVSSKTGYSSVFTARSEIDQRGISLIAEAEDSSFLRN
jgi:hypothetical protein